MNHTATIRQAVEHTASPLEPGMRLPHRCRESRVLRRHGCAALHRTQDRQHEAEQTCEHRHRIPGQAKDQAFADPAAQERHARAHRDLPDADLAQLFWCGASIQPGTGVPTVMISAGFAVDAVLASLGRTMGKVA